MTERTPPVDTAAAPAAPNPGPAGPQTPLEAGPSTAVALPPPPAIEMPAGAELVLRFLSSVGRPAEAEQYLALWKAERPESFAVLHVSAPVIDHALDALLVALRFLSQLGLCPIVTFGAVTPRGAKRDAEIVAAALGPQVPAALATIETAGALARRDIIPLLPLPSCDDPHHPDAELAADRRFAALLEVIEAVAAHKLVFVGRRSGLQPRGGRVISMIDIQSEAQELAPTLPEPQRKLLRQIERMFAARGARFSVSVTSAFDLLRELFTVKGAGTLVRRAAQITVYRHWQELNTQRLGQLVASAFGKPLAPHFFDHDLQAVYLADDYRGAAIVTHSPMGAYLSKFAVDTVARGDGIGRDLWRAMAGAHSSLFWKSRSENPITAWYREQCDGLHRLTLDGTPWTILWRGIAPAQIPQIIAYCSSLPPDFL